MRLRLPAGTVEFLEQFNIFAERVGVPAVVGASGRDTTKKQRKRLVRACIFAEPCARYQHGIKTGNALLQLAALNRKSTLAQMATEPPERVVQWCEMFAPGTSRNPPKTKDLIRYVKIAQLVQQEPEFLNWMVSTVPLASELASKRDSK